MTDREKKYLNPTTGETISKWAEVNGAGHIKKVVRAGEYPAVTVHELQVGQGKGTGLGLFYVHGGGFVSPITAGHLPAIQRIAQSLGATKVYVPEYSLSPSQIYPAALVQNIEALRAVLLHTPPSQLVLAGDSAGANFVAAILAHILVPSPYCSPLDVKEPFAAALLICPYVTYHTSTSRPTTFRLNAPHDYVTEPSEPFYHIMYQAKYGEVYAEPGAAPADFWAGLGKVVRRVQVTGGEREILLDDILAFGEKLKLAKGLDVVVQVADKAVHVELVVDLSVGIETDSTMELIVGYCRQVRASTGQA
jgi:acetyl esterase/lipase